MSEGLTDPRKAIIYLSFLRPGLRKVATYEPLLSKSWIRYHNWGAKQDVIPRPTNAVEEEVLKLGDISQHIETLYLMSLAFKTKVILELGTREGSSTMAFLQAARELRGHLYSVDKDECLEAHSKAGKYGYRDIWTFIMQDDMNLDWRIPIDHLFIDTSHEYSHTLKELQKFEPFVNPGGIITLHDVVLFPAVNKAAEQYVKDKKGLKFRRYLTNNGLGIILKES